MKVIMKALRLKKTGGRVLDRSDKKGQPAGNHRSFKYEEVS